MAIAPGWRTPRSTERAADAIVAASSAEGINALGMLGRMQVEKSLISKTVRPSQRTVDFAFWLWLSRQPVVFRKLPRLGQANFLRGRDSLDLAPDS
jgi:hypothetical protein